MSSRCALSVAAALALSACGSVVVDKRTSVCSFHAPSPGLCATVSAAAGCTSSQFNSFSCLGQGCPYEQRICRNWYGPDYVISTRVCGQSTDIASGFDFCESFDQRAPLAGTGGVQPPSRTIATRFVATPAVTITEYLLPSTLHEPGPILRIDDRIVFGSTQAPAQSAFALIDAQGTIERRNWACSGTDNQCRVLGLAPDPRGNGACFVWTARTTESGTRNIDKIVCSPFPGESGTVIESVSLPFHATLAAGLAAGHDGRIWMTDAAVDYIGRLDQATGRVRGVVLDQTAPNLQPTQIVAGPRGAMWFTTALGNAIGAVGDTGLGMRVLPNPDSQPVALTVGTGNYLWFSEYHGQRIGRFSPDGALVEFPLPGGGGPAGIAVGPDGAVWFALFDAGKVGRICHDGEYSEMALPATDGQPIGIVAGLDNDLFVTQRAANRIARLHLQAPLPTSCDWLYGSGFEF